MRGRWRTLVRNGIVSLSSVILAASVSSCGNASDAAAVATPLKDLPLSNPAAYEVSASGKRMTTKNGASIPIREGSVAGYVGAAVEGGRIGLIGWATSADYSQMATKVLAFVDAKGVASVKPSEKRLDVAETFRSPPLARSGFTIVFDRSALDCSKPLAGLTVFAIAKGAAAPVPWVKGSTEPTVEEAC